MNTKQRVSAQRGRASCRFGFNESTAIATVDHVCGAMVTTDYLEPFVAPVLPPGADRDEASGEPDFTSLGRIVAGNEDRASGGSGDFMLIDRGSDQAVTPGSRFAVYRDIGVAGMPLASVGEAIVIGDDVRVTVVEVRGGKVRLGIEAPEDVTVDRQEVHERRGQFAGDGAGPEIDCPLALLPRSR